MMKSIPWRKRSSSVSFAEMRDQVAAHIGIVALFLEFELAFRCDIDEAGKERAQYAIHDLIHLECMP